MLLDFFGYQNMCWEDTVYFLPTAKNNFIKAISSMISEYLDTGYLYFSWQL